MDTLGLSTTPEAFSDPIDEFRDPIDEFRDSIDDFRDPIDEFRDPIEDFRDPIDDFRDPIDDFRDPIDDFRDPIDDFRDPIDKFRDPNQELEDYIVGEKSSSGVDHAKPIVRKVRRLVNREVRVGVEDGRVFVGKLHCLDKQKNMILYDTVEFRSLAGCGEVEVGAGARPEEQRSLGLVLIPARCRTSCYVKCSLDEKLDFLKIIS